MGSDKRFARSVNIVKGVAGCSGATFYLDDYLKLDQDIRANFAKNLLAQAIQLDTGISNDTFSQFDQAVGALSKVNETEFDKSACRAIGQAHFGGSCATTGYVPLLQYAVLVAFPLIALATVFGLWYIRAEF